MVFTRPEMHTDFSLCVFVSAPRESKPHRLKPVLLDLTEPAPSLLAGRLTGNFHAVLVRYAG